MKHLLSLTCMLAALPAQAALFTNGDFELGTNPDASGWVRTGTSNQVAVKSSINAYNAGPSSGTRYVQFGQAGSTGGSIAQTFDTIIGMTYEVTFDFGKYGPTAGQDAVLQVSVDNLAGTIQTYTDTTGSTYTSSTAMSPTYEDTVDQIFTFTASNSSTTLTFLDASTNGSSTDMGLDNIRVAAVPEPSSTALIGLAGLGFILRRKRA
ncbi:PEP-CTERM protein-sorting domain-containing protein [Rubritalea squalenifaciens DSM 18772]|uniref:PEP-CTERM protein-sorting domain-containing protein n=1 Tax=Rubritalea squalenifaciens DSM 18772 TaxID=1123071 RepID=A0A1M6SCV0_9BACT|nr:DUF642 domain-containing protein [Rubritalea squalenifaciens]SHK42594.1 PEP-CTERM protein-sorting domain-containing protein [Rubritalea squalenifaciens DSM 18772]